MNAMVTRGEMLSLKKAPIGPIHPAHSTFSPIGTYITMIAKTCIAKPAVAKTFSSARVSARNPVRVMPVRAHCVRVISAVMA